LARYDKYEPKSGGFRAPLAADLAANGSGNPIGVGLDVNGRVVPGAGQSGIKGVLTTTKAMVAGDIVDVMTDGEIVEFVGVAGTNYFAALADGVISDSAALNVATAATLATGSVGANNGITWTARDAGRAGNGISVRILGSTGNNVALSVAVNGNDIVVTPATDGAGVITSTATATMAAIAASAPANALVATASTGASSGAGLVAATGPTNLAGGTDPGESGATYVGCTVEATRIVVRTDRS
jgi:hypothetical protein